MRPFATLPKPSILSRKHFKELPQNSPGAAFYPSNKTRYNTYKSQYVPCPVLGIGEKVCQMHRSFQGVYGLGEVTSECGKFTE